MSGGGSHGHAYDKAKWHHGSKEWGSRPESQASVHAGLVLAWMIERGLMVRPSSQETADRFDSIRLRYSAPSVLLAAFDDALVDVMFSDVGNAFLREYFDPRVGSGRFFEDYGEEVVGPGRDFYAVVDSWESYPAVERLLDRRFAEWRDGRAHAPPLTS